MLLKSTGYPDPDRIVQLWEKPPRGTRNAISPANYIDWAKQARSFESMAAQTGASVAFTGGGEPKSLRVGNEDDMLGCGQILPSSPSSASVGFWGSKGDEHHERQ